MKLSVIILNYNVRYFLELCLKSVQNAIKTIDAEIIVIDNNSDDNSCDMVKSFFPEVILIQNKSNLGFSKANNIAASQAKGEYLCILNPDTVVAEDTFLKILDFSQGIDKLGIVGCKLIDGAGCYLPESKRNIPYITTSIKKFLGNSYDYYANQLSENEIGEVSVLVGAFMVLKRDVYMELGGFDEDYFMYGEDIDLSYKALKAGYQNYYLGNVTAIHFKGESTLKNKIYAQRFYGAMQIFYKKHFTHNLVFDLFMWFGIRLLYLFSRAPKKSLKTASSYILISDKMNESIAKALGKEVVLKLHLNDIKSDSEVIFDANMLKYKQIISFIEGEKDGKSLTYKIWPNNSKFLIGSNRATARGEVINFD